MKKKLPFQITHSVTLILKDEISSPQRKKQQPAQFNINLTSTSCIKYDFRI